MRTHVFDCCLQEIEAIKARVKEMEEEAEKLKEMQGEVEKQMMTSAKSRRFRVVCCESLITGYSISSKCVPDARREARS